MITWFVLVFIKIIFKEQSIRNSCVPVIQITMLIIREDVMILISGKHFNAQRVLLENKVQIRGVKVLP